MTKVNKFNDFIKEKSENIHIISKSEIDNGKDWNVERIIAAKNGKFPYLATDDPKNKNKDNPNIQWRKVDNYSTSLIEICLFMTPVEADNLNILYDEYKKAKNIYFTKKANYIKPINRILEEDVNTDNDSGLMVIASTDEDNDKLKAFVDNSAYHGVYNEIENYWFYPEEVDMYGSLEGELSEEFNKKGISVRFEGIF